jgi:hypothetical protein
MFGGDVEPYAEDAHRAWVSAQAPLASACTFAAHVHREVSETMRDTVVDWLWDIQTVLRVGPEAVSLAIQLVDRRLATGKPVARSNLQCVGMACLLIASKMEDVELVDVDELRRLSAGSSTLKQLLAAEVDVCRTLRHDLALPAAFHFLAYYAQRVAPGCTRIRETALAAFHAVSLGGGAYASANPQLVAVGCVAWAARNPNLLVLSRIHRAAAAGPVGAVAWDARLVAAQAHEQQRRASEPTRTLTRRYLHALVAACALPGPCVAEAYRRVTLSVAAQCAPPDPPATPNSFARKRIGWTRCSKELVNSDMRRMLAKCRRQLEDTSWTLDKEPRTAHDGLRLGTSSGGGCDGDRTNVSARRGTAEDKRAATGGTRGTGGGSATCPCYDAAAPHHKVHTADGGAT